MVSGILTDMLSSDYVVTVDGLLGDGLKIEVNALAITKSVAWCIKLEQGNDYKFEYGA
jgi:hypothetical protein